MPVTQIRSLPFRTTGWSDYVTLNQADPAQGIQSIGLTVSSTLTSDVAVTSAELAASTWSSTDQATVSLGRPDGSDLLHAYPSTHTDFSFTAASDPAGSTRSTVGVVGSDTAAVTYVSGNPPNPDAALLTGTGTVTLPVIATARVSATGPGNVAAVFHSTVAATVGTVVATGGTGGQGGLGSGGVSIRGNLSPIFLLNIARSATQTSAIADQITGAVSAITFNGFDASLGQLAGVEISLGVDSKGYAKAENLDGVAGAVSIARTATVSLARGDGQAIVHADSTLTDTFQLGAFDGSVDYAGSSGQNSYSVRGLDTTIATMTDTADLTAFTGGSVTLSAARTGVTDINGPGNLAVATTLQAGANVSVTYLYHPVASVAGVDVAANYVVQPTTTHPGATIGEAAGNQFGGGLTVVATPSFVTNDPPAPPPPSAAGGSSVVNFPPLMLENITPPASALPAESPFDRAYYLATNPDVAASGMDALAHYDTYGWHEGRNPSADFDTNFYLTQNPDVKAAGVDPLTHYDTFGWHEGRDPSLLFSGSKYLAANPDVAAAGMDPLQHYLTYGRTEGRAAFLPGGEAAPDPLVNAAYYDGQLGATLFPTGVAAAQQAAFSYHATGWQRGLNPDALFDTNFYLSHNVDVAAAHIDPLQHYEQYGWHEGRDPSAAFSTKGYLAANADVAHAGLDPLLHYVAYGQSEGRAA